MAQDRKKVVTYKYRKTKDLGLPERLDSNVQGNTVKYLTIQESARVAATSRAFYFMDQNHEYYRTHTTPQKNMTPKQLFFAFPEKRTKKCLYPDRIWTRYAFYNGMTILREEFKSEQPVWWYRSNKVCDFLGSEPFAPLFPQLWSKCGLDISKLEMVVDWIYMDDYNHCVARYNFFVATFGRRETDTDETWEQRFAALKHIQFSFELEDLFAGILAIDDFIVPETQTKKIRRIFVGKRYSLSIDHNQAAGLVNQVIAAFGRRSWDSFEQWLRDMANGGEEKIRQSLLNPAINIDNNDEQRRLEAARDQYKTFSGLPRPAN